MQTARPRILDSEFSTPGGREVPQSGAAGGKLAAEPPLDHHSQLCPTCGSRLTGHRCKLICAQCGYYMSCADYY